MSTVKEDKAAVVAEVKERLDNASSVVVTEYRGLTVAALAELRQALRPAGGNYKIYKNTLVRRAVDETGAKLNVEHLVGPTALAFTENKPDGEPGDVVTVAKVLKDFAKTHPELNIKGGVFEGEAIDEAGLKQLAEIEPREVLLAKFAGLLAAPMTQFAGLLQAVPRDFAYGLSALVEKGGANPAANEAAVAEASAAEAPVEEAPAAEPAEAETETEPEAEATPAEAETQDTTTEETTKDPEDGDK